MSQPTFIKVADASNPHVFHLLNLGHIVRIEEQQEPQEGEARYVVAMADDHRIRLDESEGRRLVHAIRRAQGGGVSYQGPY